MMMIMSIYHILPSNTSPDTFPKNHASSYSTPISNPQVLEGHWEMGILSVTHSNCVNTFNHDWIKVTDHNVNLCRTKKPIKIPISIPQGKYKSEAHLVSRIADVLNKTLANIIEFKFDTHNYLTFKFLVDNYHVYLNPCLSKLIHMTNVLTNYDDFRGYWPDRNPKTTYPPDGDCYVILIPTHANHDTIRLKDKNELLKTQELVQRFLERVTLGKYSNLKLSLNDSQSHFILSQTDKQPMAILLNNELLSALGFVQTGVYPNSENRYHGYNFKDAFTDEWNLDVYPLDNVDNYRADAIVHHLTLKPKLFQSTVQLCQYLTKKIGNENIKIESKNNTAHLIMTSKDMVIEFNQDVRDILALDQSIYRGKCQVKGSDVISLSRRINYFYIYSNLGEFVRIGDTEAPLLCHFPFNPKSCGMITERVFKQPSYVKVKGSQFAQINIGIYDDAGKLIPFHQDAVTSIRLHFRRV